MEEAHTKGTPVMRTLFYHYPEDPECWKIEDEYLFGEDLLIAPVCEADVREREVYLPKGNRWREMESGMVYEGGQKIRIPAPLASIPVFIREEAEEVLEIMESWK